MKCSYEHANHDNNGGLSEVTFIGATLCPCKGDSVVYITKYTS